LSSYSDWSTQSYPRGPSSVWLRVRREADDYIIESAKDTSSNSSSTPSLQWVQIRMAHLHQHDAASAGVMAGLYAGCPIAAGFDATFDHVSLVPGRVDGKAH
jgi:regulation of enolase protein 1 (concanavalin A-like superfamily)